MKGGDVLALGVLRALNRPGREDIAEAAVLFVCDEEWRVGAVQHVERFAGYDARPSSRAAQRVRRTGVEQVNRQAQGPQVQAGDRPPPTAARLPHRGITRCSALAGAAQALAARHDPAGPEHLTVVPTVIRAGDAFDACRTCGEPSADVRADSLEAMRAGGRRGARRHRRGEARRDAHRREWPGMDSREATVTPARAVASAAIGRPIVGANRGGASDASHFAPSIPLTVDGLGPLGGGAHAPHEFVLASGLRPRAEVALAITAAVLGD